MTSNQKASTATTSSTTATKTTASCSNTIPSTAGETHRTHTVVCSNVFGRIPHQNKPSSCS